MDKIMTDALPENPFVPGIGEVPPVMGHRSDIERSLTDLLGRLQNARRGSKYAYLYGPRGNGKTVLLNWLINRAEASKTVTCLELVPDAFATEDKLQTALKFVGRAKKRILRDFVLGLSVSFPGIVDFGAEIKPGDTEKTVRIQPAKGGLLITLDEAHKVPAAHLGRFLDAVQSVGRKMPIGVVLAGTPGLEDTLRDSDASYWSRGRRLGVGRLDSTEAERVIAEPFKDAKVTVGKGIAGQLAEEADCYPYFLQVYGEAAWDAVASSGKRHLGPGQAAEAVQNGDELRCLYYTDRFEEFDKLGALTLARSVACEFKRTDDQLTALQMDALLNRDHDDGLDRAGRRRLLRAKGFIWSPKTDLWEPGIPSLMDYVIARTLTESDNRKVHPIS